jgi:hypothetical protein
MGGKKDRYLCGVFGDADAVFVSAAGATSAQRTIVTHCESIEVLDVEENDRRRSFMLVRDRAFDIS